MWWQDTILNNHDFAIIQINKTQLLLATGSFTSYRQEPKQQPFYFYRNNYNLTDDNIWLVPAKTTIITISELLAWLNNRIDYKSYLNIQWQDSYNQQNKQLFFEVFTEIKAAIASGLITKAVPFSTLRGEFNHDITCLYWQTLLQQITEQHYFYAYQINNQGMVGYTPEILFSKQQNKLQTLALAGTCHQQNEEQIKQFLCNSKEGREQAIVQEVIAQRLAKLGSVNIAEKYLTTWQTLSHWQTDISVNINDTAITIAEIVKLLHPTPALGCYPRSKEILQLEQQWQQKLQPYPYFSAPFGCKYRQNDSDKYHFIMTIRGIFWEHNQCYLPAGCGIIQESNKEKEWQEIKVKQRAIQEILKIKTNKRK